jgi:hypothetical protein
MPRYADHPLKLYEFALMLWHYGLTAGMIAKGLNRRDGHKSTGRMYQTYTALEQASDQNQ